MPLDAVVSYVRNELVHASGISSYSAEELIGYVTQKSHINDVAF